MATHISILPTDVLDALSVQLNQTGAAPDASSLRFLRLPHPRTGIASLFLPCPKSSAAAAGSSSGSFQSSRDQILEVQAVAPHASRSWLAGEGEIIADGKLLMMTPIDPAFMLLPVLKAIHPVDGTLGTFRPIDDLFEEAAMRLTRDVVSSSKQDPTAAISEQDVMVFSRLDCVLAAVPSVCEVKELTPELRVYRFSPAKAVEYMQKKVERLSQREVIERSRTVTRSLAKDGLMEDGKEILLDSGRTRAACELLSQYLPADIYKSLLACYDFSALNLHRQDLHDADAAALAQAGTNVAKPGKKGKDANAEKEENGKKRKNTTHGVEQLKKANITGMKKLSSFFAAKG